MPKRKYPKVIVQLFERNNGWSTVWTAPYTGKEARTAVLYALDKVLDGSDADAFRVYLDSMGEDTLCFMQTGIP